MPYFTLFLNKTMYSMPKQMQNSPIDDNAKLRELNPDKLSSEEQFLTTNQGLRINDNNNSLKAGARGSTLLEDFILREKITHFDHERIPERIVHARGSGAHGVFELYEPIPQFSKAHFLNDITKPTPVFVRFSTVAGSKGSSDLARDVRGFAIKFYTDEGIFDMVGNNIPVFFIQDAMKFPDLVHAVKPEPDNEIPQAASAHDTFWDFISLMPESMHMIMWAMSDRTLPRSLRMIEGFGVHSFRLINAEGKAHFIKFHFKPLLGVHSVCWDEAQKISGKDPDYHRRDLWENIEAGNFPEWEMGFQIIPEEDELKFDIDLLDPTKLIPEELVPITKIGKLTLNRNPDNFFSETEQVAFHPGHIVPGIDFTNDPLLQGRLFSYTDTQLSRLGSPNFHEIPINRPTSPVHNLQRDGHMRQTINVGKANYFPNSIGGGCPYQAAMAQGGFTSYPERINAVKVRDRSQSFSDHFSQAILFFNSQSETEKRHITDALTFELGNVTYDSIKIRTLGLLSVIDKKMAQTVADGLGMNVPHAPEMPMNKGVGADANMQKQESDIMMPQLDVSKALSMENTIKNTIKTRQIALLAADGVDNTTFGAMRTRLEMEGAKCHVISIKGGSIKTNTGNEIVVDKSLLNAASVFYDACYVCAGAASANALKADPRVIHFLNETFKHCKAIAAEKEGVSVVKATAIPFNNNGETDDAFMILDKKADYFINAIAQHRNWEREKKPVVPA
jgi:catalase